MCDPEDTDNLDELDEEYLADVETNLGWYEVQEMDGRRERGWLRMSNFKTVYPRTKFTDESGVISQFIHLESELKEIGETLPGQEKFMAEEVCDLIHSAETLLHILHDKHGVDVAAVQRQVVEKNRKRKYYPVCERCAAPRCAKAECIACREYQCCADLGWRWCNEKCVDFIPKEATNDG